MNALGPAIRARRRELGMTLDALATRAKCSKAYLSGIENDRFPHPPRAALLGRIERALKIAPRTLRDLADWQQTPASVKQRLADRGVVDAAPLAPHSTSTPLRRIPVINKLAAGAPAGYTDLDYPVDVADEYTAAPLDDPSAFAARVAGDSMCPEYRDGDLVVFSPARDPVDGADCLVRIEPDHETTFKRIYFEGAGLIRLQPLNPAFPPQTLPRQRISGLFPAVAVIHTIPPPKPRESRRNEPRP